MLNLDLKGNAGNQRHEKRSTPLPVKDTGKDWGAFLTREHTTHCPKPHGVIQNEITSLGYSLLTMNTDDLKSFFNTQIEFSQYLDQSKIAGFLILGDIDEAFCKLLCSQEIPIVGASFISRASL